VALNLAIHAVQHQRAALKWQHHADQAAVQLQHAALKSLLVIHAQQLHPAIADVA
jgi:hypothetical protein